MQDDGTHLSKEIAMSQTIFERLREDHERQRDLINALVRTHGDTDERREIYSELREELEVHAAAEEQAFYRHLMASDLTLEKARHSVAEHKELDDLLEALTETDPSSPGWLPQAKALRERLLHHLEEEEHEVFQMAGKALSNTQKTQLVGAFEQARERHAAAA